ncbi:orange carotenoid protein N-terminal domain-containing protein [Crocosphaera sp. XPORK-15E]|uniref:orange carotenoid protein N-terminal domain-containing protein n=1 Tax=Crocosphaera sp. XPORK-15E TaxID=3110247 RepID=UPI002B1EDB73|nr:orange carotenoid protein N-terminal domain-containing protein [Crocosphaera sp. XPORK-15E]MEA5535701.1 orange carotenoid protein N-terminal domain-containing protein [Crocosphaera sp. XPORK-15E]
MTYTATNPATILNNQAVDVTSVTARFQRLSTDDKLGLLWVAYTEIGRSITPAATGAARLQFAEGILNQVKQMSQDEQLKFMRDLVKKVSTPITRAYGTLTNNTKLAFWYQLAELMESGVVIPVPPYYKLTQEANNALVAIQNLDFNQQITVLRNAVVDMGVDPLA